MNNKQHKDSVVSRVTNDAEARIKQKDAPEENVELKLENGVVFASIDGLITVMKLNSRRTTLSKAEKGIFDRVILTLEKYRSDGIAIGQLDENSSFFFSGEKIIYVGGQLDSETEYRLEKDKEYTVFDNRKGKIGDGPWFPCVTLEEFPGTNPNQRPGFLITMFKKKPKEETRVVQMPQVDTSQAEQGENDWGSPGQGKDSPYS